MNPLIMEGGCWIDVTAFFNAIFRENRSHGGGGYIIPTSNSGPLALPSHQSVTSPVGLSMWLTAGNRVSQSRTLVGLSRLHMCVSC